MTSEPAAVLVALGPRLTGIHWFAYCEWRLLGAFVSTLSNPPRMPPRKVCSTPRTDSTVEARVPTKKIGLLP
jgi:hypothetical protein